MNELGKRAAPSHLVFSQTRSFIGETTLDQACKDPENVALMRRH